MTTAAKNLARAFARDESGATAIEYGLIVALVFLAVLTSVNLFTTNTGTMYSEISSALN